MNIVDIKQEIIHYGIKIKDTGLIAGTWGNISARFEDRILITPSGIEYEELTPKDIIVCDFDGNILEGDLNPSIELTTHIAIYKNRGDVNAIIHTHSVYASAIAAAKKNIPAILEDMAMVIGGEVRCAKYASPGSEELADNVMEVLEHKNAVLLANHGSYCMGRTLKEAFLTCQVLEKSAQVYIFSAQIGIPKPLAIEEVEKIREVYLTHYAK